MNFLMNNFFLKFFKRNFSICFIFLNKIIKFFEEFQKKFFYVLYFIEKNFKKFIQLYFTGKFIKINLKYFYQKRLSFKKVNVLFLILSFVFLDK